MTRYRLIYTLLLTAMLAGGSITSMAQTTGVVVKGNVYGGGKLADVKTNTAVNMSTGTVEKNVFGGGMGKADNFTCDKAMVGIGINDDGVTLVSGTGENAIYTLKDGGTTVTITNGTVIGDVYGGGEVGRVERNTIVTIGEAGNTSLTPIVQGHVFGAGKGVETHGYSALVRGNVTVTIQGQAQVWQNVHGGGEKASVGRYYVAQTQSDAERYHVRIGMPCYLKAGGKCTVNILDGATIGKEANTGDVYGAGQGIRPDYRETDDAVTGKKRSKRMMPHVEYASGVGHNPADEGTTWDYYVDDEGIQDTRYVWEYFTGSTGPNDYLLFVETLARASETDVVIGGKRVDASTITTSSGAPTVKGTVYGGSESGFVYYGTLVNIPNGTVEGDAFGGGKGLDSYSEAGRVRRNTNLTVSGGTVKGNVYGGGSLGDVGYITKNFTNYNHTWKQNDGETPNASHNNSPSAPATNTGVCNVTISNGSTIGINGTVSSEHGNVFGAGKGKDDTWWCEKAMVFATNVSISDASTKVYGSVFGGGEIGRVEDDAKVTIGTSGGSDTPNITGSVFGAGKGLATHGYSALLRGNTEVTVQGGATVGHSVYGGGEIATVGRYVVVNGVPTEPDGGGDCTVTIKDNAEIAENVFGAGQGVDPATYSASGENRSKRMMVYDPGRDYAGGPYEWEYITTYGTSYEGTKYVWEYFTREQFVAFLETLALASDTEVEIGGTSGKTTKVNGSVYGGSESGFLQRHTQVTIQDYCEIGTTSGTTGGNVFGGGKGLAGYAAGGRVSGYTNVAISGGTTCTMHGSVYGGGENGIVKGGVKVDLSGGTVNKDVYGGGALADTNTGNGIDYIAVPEIPSNPKNAGLYDKEYVSAGSGTAQEGVTYYEDTGSKYVVKSVAVGDPLTGLYVVEYNETEDETADANKTYYTQTHPTTVNLLGGTIGGDAYGGGLGDLARLGTDHSSVEAKVYGDVKVNLNGMAIDEYNSAFSEYVTALDVDNDYTNDYYMVNPTNAGCKVRRVFGCNNLNGSPKSDVTVHVYGTQNPLKTTIRDKFISDNIDLEKGETEEDVPYLTRLKDIHAKKVVLATALGVNTGSYQIGESPSASDVKTAINNITGAIADAKTAQQIRDVKYDMRAVYGGGNEASYDPTTPNTSTTTTPNGSRVQVIIEGCDYTSIETVYGGGNAAPVPESNVTITSDYEIETVFGGGNGKDNKESDNSANEGADIGTLDQGTTRYGTGNANTMITGGYIHEAYGGSNERGTIMGTVNLKSEADGICSMVIGKMVTAGKNADIMGDAITILGCMPDSWVDEYYGGADNANVHGNVELTITSGKFRKVFGGNNKSGIIMGHIKVNIEETGCRPIEIDELYLGGNEASYSYYGYYLNTKTENGVTTPILNESGKYTFKPRESATDKHKAVKKMFKGSSEPAVYSGEGDDIFTNYGDQPELNIISCTRIGKVFGGGLGETAVMYADPTVNINQVYGTPGVSVSSTLGAIGGQYVNDKGETVDGGVFGGGNEAAVYGNTTVNIGTEQDVYVIKSVAAGADVSSYYTYDEGSYTAASSTAVDGTTYYEKKAVLGANIVGNVYGGGNLANVGNVDTVTETVNGKPVTTDNVLIKGSTSVNICAVKDTEILDDEDEPTGRYNYTSVSFAEGAPGVIILGNVYGGGKGEDKASGEGAFRCGKAMVTGSTSVAICNGIIGNGTTGGAVYGGGQVGRVEENTVVTIGSENDTHSAPVINGNVFGAGAGVNTHGYSALTRGNSYVTVQGEAKVKKSVYGGGEIASVGKYNINAQGLPESLANQGSGYCTVIVRDNAVIGPDEAMIMTATGYPDDMGHVFGAGKGVLPYEGYGDTEVAWRTSPTNTKQNYLSKNQAINGTDESEYLTYVETLGLATQTYVTIDDNAFVKGSVYGGSENGYVQHDTQVNIKGNCQIGNGYVQMDDNGNYLTTKRGVNRRYTAKEWEEGHLFVDGDPEIAMTTPENPGDTPAIADATEAALRTAVGSNYTSSLPECASWPYGQATGDAKYAPWDKYYGTSGYDSKGGRTTADDGHTFYGNVFGGGSGLIPYRPGKWHPEAGSVAGNTVVNITGGHILTSVYGGNELTDVYGNCTVNFGGTATLGVPRTLKQIDAHPVTCYLFGAGKGDQRVLFNKSTNVNDVEVNVTGGTIYGSVFGGGEDGHVHHDVTMTIGNDDHTGPKIGTWGTSYVEGNVFGAGRGFGGDAYTAGNVAGSVTMKIKGGSILGSVYGGGRLGSVGYGLFDAKTTSGADMPGYGEMRPDNTSEDSNPTTASGFKRGYVDIEISGGIIGNDHEYLYVAPNTSADDLAILKTNNYMPNTEFELVKDANDNDVYRLKHTKGGNVFAGGMGRRKKLNGDVIGSAAGDIDWTKLGNVKQTKLKITGGLIKSNVYGGGELGAVIYANGSTTEGGKTEIEISGTAEIGTVITEAVTTGTGESAQTNYEPRYTFGSVYGAGMGSEDDTSTEAKIGGRVEGSTKIDMKGGTVRASVYGGGELAVVQGSHIVKDSNGDPILDSENKQISVGTEVNISGTAKVGYNQDGFGGATMGNVYGAGKGSLNTKEAGLIKKNTWISISGTPNIYHNIYGGGAYGSVGTFTYSNPVGGTQPASTPSGCTEGTGTAWINITGGTIGINGHENGMVFGSSRGDVAAPVPDATTGEDPNNKLAWVSNTYVTIGTEGQGTTYTTPWIRGSVYGSGENGHVLNDTYVTVHSGKIGIEESDGSTYDITSGSTTYKGAEYGTRGNVYGGGCGTDTYDITGSDAVTKYYFNRSAGVVRGNTTITMDGGKVVRSIYGGGAMGSVGKFNRSDKTADDPCYSDSNVPGFISSCTPNTGLCSVTISGGQVGPSDTTIPNGAGNVFGASRGEIHDATLYPNLDRMAYADNTEVSISGTASIKGSVYGGGETGNVMDNTEVNVCAEKQTSGETVTYVAASGTPTIGGNVYGGGKGSADNFTCDKAMVGLVDKGVTGTGTTDDPFELQPGGTTVRIYNGTVGTLVGATGSQTLKDGTGNVYGGGEIARVERNTVVEIGAASGTTAPIIQGSVFAAGAGLETHGYSALVRGTSTVTVQGSAQVKKNVYGGGEKASVGRYKVKIKDGTPPDAPASLPAGMPYGLKAGGTSYVNILGSATIGTDNVATTGHVYGAGKGIEPTYVYNGTYTEQTPYTTRITNSKRMANYSSSTHTGQKRYTEWDYYNDDTNSGYVWEYFTTKDAYLQFIETLAISASTDVTINGTKTTGYNVMGSVFGGSESGFVYQNTDVKIQGGIVKGDAFGGGQGLESFAEAGRVRWNTNLAVSGGAVQGNVYGGGKLGDVGTIDKRDPEGKYNYFWKNSLSNGNTLDADHNNNPLNNTITSTESNPNTNTGICTVGISGGEIGLASLSSTDKPEEHGNVFGAGRGSSTTWWCEKAIVFATNVSVSKGTVNGNVYGGGEVGRVEDDAKVTIGTPSGTDNLTITGSVYGAGAGLATHGYSALVRGNADVIVQGSAQIGGSVYGGGEIASVGKFTVPNGLPKDPLNGGTCKVIIQGNAKIGTSGITHNVFGACKGVTPAYNNTPNDPNRSKSMQLLANAPENTDLWSHYNNDPSSLFIWRYYATEDDYLDFLKTLALTSNTHVTIGGSSEVYGSVYGGGERGITLGGTDVNMTSGTVFKDFYGGGALADTNTSMWDADQSKRLDYVTLPNLIAGSPATGYYTAKSANALITDPTATVQSGTTYYAIYKTNVNLLGGKIVGNAYGGGLGSLGAAAIYYSAEEATAYNSQHNLSSEDAGYVTTETVKTSAVAPIEAKVYGDVLVELNNNNNGGDANGTKTGCIVNQVFGCNNLNGSPQGHVKVHVFATQSATTANISTKARNRDNPGTNDYDVKAVYGGGNLAKYEPVDPTPSTPLNDTEEIAEVIIDGCNLTSIGTVYGGGNAASVPATVVTVNGTYEIGKVFGGGNGDDAYEIDGKIYQNPGANVGLRNYTHLGTGAGTVADPIPAVNNTDPDASTKGNRETNYGYGLGKTHATIYGGTVHAVYGGSNKRGNVRVESRTTLEDLGCDFTVGDAYGGGNNAPQDGDAVLEIGCIGGMEKAYGGAADADINGNVVLNITNGTYGQVFGGNDAGGAIRGSITVNIEETGCKPVIIGELYGGGCNAAYSVYGYNDDGSVKETGSNPVADPVVNVKSFTSIGSIYGGGYGAPATMVGNPVVNINVTKGKYSGQTSDTYFTNKGFVLDTDATKKRYSKVVDATDNPHTVYVPTHEADKIGAIYNVFGGGNAADVIGTPHVNIGTLTGEVITLVSQKIEDSEGRTPSDANWIPSYQLATVEGVDIRDNVYGAGNNANVTGDAEVVIGKNNAVKTYSFTSYGTSSGGTAYSTGLAQTTGVTKNNLSEVVILTNGEYGDFVGRKYYVSPTADTTGGTRTELKDKDGNGTSLYVVIKPFEQKKTYNFTSWSAQTGGTQYSTGTAAPTGNFKTFSSTEYMQIQVLTNPGETSWVGKTFYVPTTAETDGTTRTQLYKADGTGAGVWVAISEEVTTP